MPDSTTKLPPVQVAELAGLGTKNKTGSGKNVLPLPPESPKRSISILTGALTQTDEQRLGSIVSNDIANNYYLFKGEDISSTEKQLWESMDSIQKRIQTLSSTAIPILDANGRAMTELWRVSELSFQKKKLLLLQMKITEKSNLLTIRNSYLTSIKNEPTTSYIPEMVAYVHNNVHSIRNVAEMVKAEKFVYIDRTVAKNIIDTFKKENLVKIRKSVSGITINSDQLYLSVIWADGKIFYVDESFYQNIRRSYELGYPNFIVYPFEYNSWFEHPIYDFITGVDKNEEYYITLTKRIIEKGDERVIKTLSAYNSGRGDYTSDVSRRGILIRTLLILTGRSQTPKFDSSTVVWIDPAQLLELFKNIM